MSTSAPNYAHFAQKIIIKLIFLFFSSSFLCGNFVHISCTLYMNKIILAARIVSAGVIRKVRASMRAVTVQCTIVRAVQQCIVQSLRKVHFPSPLYEGEKCVLWGFVIMFEANTVLFGDRYRQIQ